MDDKTALEDMRQGGKIGFEMLHKRYLPRLNALLVKKYSHLTPDTADDICQEVFITFYQKFDKFEEKSSLMRWLFRIAQNKIIDDWRKAGKTENLPLESLEEEESFFVFDEQEENRFCYVECIGHALRRQGTNEPDCLTALIFSFPKPSIDKIANEIGISHKEAKALLNRCKRQLKNNPSCLTVLMLFDALELSQKEIAKMLAKTPSWVGNRMHTCRQQLKNDAGLKSCYEECID